MIYQLKISYGYNIENRYFRSFDEAYNYLSRIIERRYSILVPERPEDDYLQMSECGLNMKIVKISDINPTSDTFVMVYHHSGYENDLFGESFNDLICCHNSFDEAIEDILEDSKKDPEDRIYPKYVYSWKGVKYIINGNIIKDYEGSYLYIRNVMLNH